MQRCVRCGRRLGPSDPRDIISGRIYDLYCGWKTARENLERDEMLRTLLPDNPQGQREPSPDNPR